MPLPFCDQPAEAGNLYLVATPIGNLGDLSPRVHAILSSVDLIACETPSVTSKLLKYLDASKPTFRYHDPNEVKAAEHLLHQLQEGKSVAVVTDAGTPAINDPGFCITRLCKKHAIPVVSIPGACAFVAALNMSGLPTDKFAFLGFFPKKPGARDKILETYGNLPLSLVFYESCHRIEKTVNQLAEILAPTRLIFVAKELTKKNEKSFIGTSREVLELIRSTSQKGEFVLIIAPKDYQL